MKLGYLTSLSEDECRLAAKIGYDCLEVYGKWEVADLKKKGFIKSEAQNVKAMLDEYALSISAIAVYRAAYEDRKPRVERYSQYIKMCQALGVGVITTLVGTDPAKNLEENLKEFQAVFSQVAPRAKDAGVKIAFENWPALMSSFPPVQTINFCFTPAAWEQMFNRVDSDAMGLEFDPSHLVWQSIDWAGALQKFMPRVHHVHAKDTEIFCDRLSANGFFSGGWWRYRLPGYGLVDWHKFTSMLKEGGYDGGICVEHEDPVFGGPRREEGLQKAHAYLRPMV